MTFNGINFDTYLKNYPDANGYFGKYGGCYIAPELKDAMKEITDAYFTICKSSKFIGYTFPLTRKPLHHLPFMMGRI